MSGSPFRIAMSMRITGAASYFEPRDSISHDWIALAARWRSTPLLIPNGLDDPVAYLEALSADLLLLTGGDDPGTGTPRDRTETRLLESAARTGTPVLGVCRGLQFINLHFGGGLDPVPGHVAVSHRVAMNGAFRSLYGDSATVNSYHTLAVSPGRLGTNLMAAATDSQGNVEALLHLSLPIAAVMWHPERADAPDGDRALVEALITKGAFWCRPH